MFEGSCVGDTASPFFLVPHALSCHFPALLCSSLPLFLLAAGTCSWAADWLCTFIVNSFLSAGDPKLCFCCEFCLGFLVYVHVLVKL